MKNILSYQYGAIFTGKEINDFIDYHINNNTSHKKDAIRLVKQFIFKDNHSYLTYPVALVTMLPLELCLGELNKMITIFIITDNIRHWAEDKGYPNECIRHTREKTTVCIGDIQIIITNKLPITLRGYKIDKWIIDKPITRREFQEIQWSFNPARVIETKKFEFINPHHTRLEWDGYDDRGWYCTSCDKDFGHDKPDYEFCPYCGAEWE